MNDRLSSHRLLSPGIALLILAVVGASVFLTVRHVASQGPARVEIPAPVSAEDAPTAINTAALYERRVNGVVTIEASFPGQTEAAGGSGFVVDGDGYILTSAHVVIDYYNRAQEASSIYVEFFAGDRVPATLVGRDHFNDVAVLKVDPREVELAPVPLGDSDKLAIGEPVAAIGAPFGNKATLTSGIVSARRSVNSKINRASRIADAIQTSAAINVGNSGGPLFNARGEVVGIAQQINSTNGANTGVSFGIPINTARGSLEQIRSTGSVSWAHLGVRTEDVTPQMARRFDLPVERGAIVQEVEPRSAASGVLRTGRAELFMGEEIVLGDVVTKIAGVAVHGKEDVTRIVSRLQSGARAEIVFWRDGRQYSATVTTGEKTVA